MSSRFAIGPSELGTVATEALNVWGAYKEAPNNLKALSGEIASLHIVLKEVQFQIQETILEQNSQQELTGLVRQCQLVLQDLQVLIEEYTTSSNAGPEDREEWSEEDILGVRTRLVSSTNRMIEFNSTITGSHSADGGSHAARDQPRRASQSTGMHMHIEADIGDLLQQKIRRRHTLAASATSSGSTTRRRDSWVDLVGELRGIGVPSELIKAHKDHLIHCSRLDSEDDLPVEAPQKTTLGTTPQYTQCSQTSQPRRGGGFGSKWRPLHFLFSRLLIDAARSGDVDALKSRLRFVNNIDCKDSDGTTALQWAVLNGHTAIVQVLLENGADLVTCDWGAQALNVAAQNGYSEIVQCLLDKGVYVDAPDPNKTDYTPLLWAASCGHAEVVNLLLHRGARTHLIDHVENDPKSCCSALVYAATNGHAAATQLLLDKAPNSRTKARWLELVLDLTAGSWKYKMGMAYVLMKKGGRHIDKIIDREDTTALHVAVDRNNVPLVTQLLDKGANIEKPDIFKMTALHKAVRSGQAEMVQLLLARGANISATTSNGSSALHMAVNHPPPRTSAFDTNHGERSSRIVELLLNHGADVFKEDDEGKTPLDHLPNSDPHFTNLVNALLLAEMERYVTVPTPRGPGIGRSSPGPPGYEEAQNEQRE